jgi:type I restriction enzyme M protein
LVERRAVMPGPVSTADLPMFEQAFRNIDDFLRKEAGRTTELDYTVQTSGLLFLKYERNLAALAALKKSLLHQVFAEEL